MEKARRALSLSDEESEAVSRLDVRPPSRSGVTTAFYGGFSLRGIRVDSIRPGYLCCSFKVPPRLTDSDGNFSVGAIATLVDTVGAAAMHAQGHHLKVSVDMSIAFMSVAKVDDELEISSEVLGHKGSYSGIHVILRNRKSGQVVAEGRHSLFGKIRSKI